MRKIFILLFSTLLLGSSCSKFLEQSSKDLIRPVTVEHYKELLQGEGYFKDFYKNGWFVDMMTDDIGVYDLGYPTTNVNTKAELVKFAYQWGEDLENPTGTFTDRFFQSIYKSIAAANACIQVIDELEGTETERSVLKGQAYFTRAYGYFVLANLYAQAYNESNENDLCIPIILNTTPTLNGHNRATMKEVWDLITSDIEIAVTSLQEDKVVRSVYEINNKAALVLATRVHLFKEDYDKVILYGEKFMQTVPSLKNISAIATSPSRSGASKGDPAFLYAPANPEVLFTFSRMSGASSEGTYLHYSSESTGIAQFVFAVSAGVPSSLMDSYELGDRRKTHWFAQPSGIYGDIFAQPYYSPLKAHYYDLSRTSQSMRSAEVYLNMAEAYARKTTPDQGKAIDFLNQLRSKRIANYTNLANADFTDGDGLVSFVLEERRRELCFEEFHRWWDLRRTGQPALQHQFMEDVYELKEKDPAYVLNFPKDEREFNPGLVPNNRPNRPAK